MLSREVLVIGRTGQVALALGQIRSPSGLGYRCVGRPEIDVTVPATVAAAVARYQPPLIINAAAWTAVDLAESRSSEAFALNAEAPATLAVLCRSTGVPLIHLSTDYVFNGRGATPYAVDHPIEPVNVYGAAKAAGEAAVRDHLPQHVILRLAWLYSDTGNNFVTKILRLAAERPSLAIVDDQQGSPTLAHDAAAAIDRIADQILRAKPFRSWGTYHLTNAGQTTWYGFAQEIVAQAHRFGHPKPAVRPIATHDCPTAAQRPAYSVLDTSLTRERFGIVMPHWQDAVARSIASRFAKLQPGRER